MISLATAPPIVGPLVDDPRAACPSLTITPLVGSRAACPLLVVAPAVADGAACPPSVATPAVIALTLPMPGSLSPSANEPVAFCVSFSSGTFAFWSALFRVVDCALVQ